MQLAKREDGRKASLVLVKMAQKDAFKEEMQTLSHGKLPHSHQMSHLDPVPWSHETNQIESRDKFS